MQEVQVRTVLAGLIIGFFIVLVALVVAGFGALGVAAIGLLLSRWFELTQWQGSLLALPLVLFVAFAVYRMAAPPEQPAEPEWLALLDEDEIETAAPGEPPVVPWRQRRPTPGKAPGRQRKGSDR